MTEFYRTTDIAMRNDTRIFELYSFLLNNCPTLLRAEDVNELTGDLGARTEAEAANARTAAVYGLLSAACGIDENDRHFAKNYLYASLACLSPAVYREDAYYKTVRFPAVREKSWELRTLAYAPYELFVRNDPLTRPDRSTVPQIGFFAEEFRYPAVLEGGREWMTVTPNEIETMRSPIAQAQGNALAFGLGLGYFAFMASEKQTVDSVTVIERDENVISLFVTHLLPQFPHKEKIRIVHADAFDFAARELSRAKFDTAFVDLWHDASDGIPLYLRMKRYETNAPATRFSYWIEKTLFFYLRRRRFAMIAQKALSDDAAARALSDEGIRQAVSAGIFDPEFLSPDFCK